MQRSTIGEEGHAESQVTRKRRPRSGKCCRFKLPRRRCPTPRQVGASWYRSNRQLQKDRPKLNRESPTSIDQVLREVLCVPGTDEALTPETLGAIRTWRSASGRSFPESDGIIRFVDSDDFAGSFGMQWNRFDVQRPAEDAEVFAVKTGLKPSDLTGMRVLDAGCGGGRYCAVAAQSADVVLGIDRSRAVDKARSICRDRDNVGFIQGDIADPPLRPASFDFVYSIGVLHHAPDPVRAFAALAKLVRPGGRLSVWVYRRNHLLQEALNQAARAVTTRLPAAALLPLCQIGAIVGAIPVVNRTLNKLVNFSNHPSWTLRVCDNFDWYSPRYQYHHTPEEVLGWFRSAGFREIYPLPPAKKGKLYIQWHDRGWIPGSGVNVTGLKT